MLFAVIPACSWRESSDFRATGKRPRTEKALDSRQKRAGMTSQEQKSEFSEIES
jgi:hypothetical protein